MSDYEYTSVNRLQNPHAYMYTPFGGKDFIQAYFQDRDFHNRRFDLLTAQQKLTSTDSYLYKSSRYLLEENKHSVPLPFMSSVMSFVDSEEIITEKILFSLLGAQFSGESHDTLKKIIDALVQRFEVTKKLFYKYHTLDLRQGKGESQNAYIYWLFSLVLTLYFHGTKNVKYLSTILKVNDLLCSLENQYLAKIPIQGLKLVLSKEVESISMLINIHSESSSCT